MLDSLLKPFSLGKLELPNRLVMAPMTRNHSKNRIPGPDVAAYYRRRAEGGVGLIVTEGTGIGHPAAHGYPDVPSIFGAEALAGWKRVVDEVHGAGGRIFPQLWHVGSVRQRHPCENPGIDNPRRTNACHHCEIPGFAPSPIPHPYIAGGEIPHEMTVIDIQEVIAAFAQAAKNAAITGFDGVEIHGAHGYLIDQFFWDRTNRRMDEYGGKTLAKRARFAVELVKAVRDAVGSDYPISFRFSQWKLGDYQAKIANTPEDLETLVVPLAEAGVDLFHCSTRRFWEPEFPDSPLNLAGWTKRLSGKPSITVGSVGMSEDFVTAVLEGKSCQSTPSHLQELTSRLERGEFDLVAVGRALLADPAWLQKMTQEKNASIRPFSKELLASLY